jgi:hypothetical protein
MPRTKRVPQSKKKHNNNESETDNNNVSSSPDEENTHNKPSPEAESPTSNFGTISNGLSTSTNTLSEIPLRVKQYIDVTFEKQTLEIKAFLQGLHNNSSLPHISSHNLDSDSDTNSNRNINRFGNLNERTRDLEPRTPKRPATHTHNNGNNNNDLDCDNNKDNNKRNRTSQGKQPRTNTSEPLQDAENMLQGYMQGSISNVTFPLHKSDTFSLRPASHTPFPRKDQDNSPHTQDNSAVSFPNSPWLFQTYDPIDYKDPSYDPKSELDQITNPIAKETEETRLWWTTTFKKDG